MSALVALLAALFTWQQANVAKLQLQDTREASAEDDIKRKKRIAIDLGQDWCRTEAPSPIGILREVLIALDRSILFALLQGEAISIPIEFLGELTTFFDEVLLGHTDNKNIQINDSKLIVLSQGYAHFMRNFLARRLNFFEVVAAAYNSELADPVLIQQFFGRILITNPSYRLAVAMNGKGWPELAKFYTLLDKLNC